MDKQTSDNVGRTAIWSVTEAWRATFFTIFFINMGMMSICVTWSYTGTPPRFIESIINVEKGLSVVTVFNVAFAFFLTEVYRMLSEMIAEKYKLRRYIQGKADGRLEGIAEGRSEGIAEGKSEGIAEANRLWLDWIKRRDEVLSKGLVFNESPPSETNSSN